MPSGDNPPSVSADDHQPDPDSFDRTTSHVYDALEDKADDLTERDGHDTVAVLASPPDSSLIDLARQEDGQTKVSHFLILRQLGKGGFGSVYLADDTRLNRRVAVKIAHEVHSDEATLFYSRVMREGRAAARLDHPHIVPIYEVAEHKGRPIIVGKYVEGMTLAEKMKAGRFTHDQAATMCRQIASAVGYANSRGIVHRDLKPGNILLDNQNYPYVTDFGLAKYESVEDTISSEGGYLGTPAYMSPEQAAGLSHSVDSRSDVYAIGVILFEILTGERPFRGNTKMLLHQVIFDEPPSPRALVHTIPRDLETICLKCLQKDRQRRYETCEQVADELGRFLGGHPILARPISKAQLMLRWCHRHQTITFLALAFLASLTVGIAGITWQWQRAEQNSENERIARTDADRANEQLSATVTETRRLLYHSRLALAEQAVSNGRLHQIGSLLSPFDSDRRVGRFDFEYFYLKNLEKLLTNRFRHVEAVTDISFHPNNRALVVAGLRTVAVFDSQSGEQICSVRAHQARVHCVAFVPGTNLFATASDDGFVKFWDMDTGMASEPSIKTGAANFDLDFYGASGLMAVAQSDGKIGVWDYFSRKQLRVIPSHAGRITGVRFVNTGRDILTSGEDHGVGLWNREQGKFLKSFASLPSPVACIDSHDTDGWVVAGYMSGQIRSWKMDGSIVSTIKNSFLGPVGTITCLDDGLCAISAISGETQVRDIKTGAVRFLMPTHGESLGTHAIPNNKYSLATAGEDGMIQLLNTNLEQYQNAFQLDHNETAGLDFAGKTPRCVARNIDGALFLLSTDHRANAKPVSLDDETVSAFDACLDGSTLCISTREQRIGFYDIDDARWKRRIDINGKSVTAIALLNSDRNAIIGCDDGAVCFWTCSEDSFGPQVHVHRGEVTELVACADGELAYSVGLDGVIFEYDCQRNHGSLFATLAEPLFSVAVSHDQRELAVGSGDGTIHRFDRISRKPLPSLIGHVGPVQSIVYLPSNRTLASGANDRQIRLWDLDLAETKLKLTGHNRAIRKIALSHDGTVLLSGDSDGLVMQWDAPRD
jgi:serine/threonine protein kinase/WD40 repeat protein